MLNNIDTNKFPKKIERLQRQTNEPMNITETNLNVDILIDETNSYGIIELFNDFIKTYKNSEISNSNSRIVLIRKDFYKNYLNDKIPAMQFTDINGRSIIIVENREYLELFMKHIDIFISKGGKELHFKHNDKDDIRICLNEELFIFKYVASYNGVVI